MDGEQRAAGGDRKSVGGLARARRAKVAGLEGRRVVGRMTLAYRRRDARIGVWQTESGTRAAAQWRHSVVRKFWPTIRGVISDVSHSYE